MFEEEQRLRRGLELSEMQKLDKLLGFPHLIIILLYFVVVVVVVDQQLFSFKLSYILFMTQ